MDLPVSLHLPDPWRTLQVASPGGSVGKVQPENHGFSPSKAYQYLGGHQDHVFGHQNPTFLKSKNY